MRMEYCGPARPTLSGVPVTESVNISEKFVSGLESLAPTVTENVVVTAAGNELSTLHSGLAALKAARPAAVMRVF